MWNDKNKWLTVSLINLAVVALLGVVLRSKILFPIPGIDFKNLLHAHSHFAFGGWITLCLLVLMTYEILPRQYSKKPVYKWLLTGVFLCAVGMLFTFHVPGVCLFFYSILYPFHLCHLCFQLGFYKGYDKKPTGKTCGYFTKRRVPIVPRCVFRRSIYTCLDYCIPFHQYSFVSRCDIYLPAFPIQWFFYNRDIRRFPQPIQGRTQSGHTQKSHHIRHCPFTGGIAHIVPFLPVAL